MGIQNIGIERKEAQNEVFHIKWAYKTTLNIGVPMEWIEWSVSRAQHKSEKATATSKSEDGWKQQSHFLQHLCPMH